MSLTTAALSKYFFEAHSDILNTIRGVIDIVKVKFFCSIVVVCNALEL